LRESAAVASPALSISGRMSATSITVTASASTSVPNGSRPEGPPLALIDLVGMGQRRTKPLIS